MIPAGSGVLTTLEVQGYADDFCISDEVLSGSDASTFASSSSCTGVSYCSADADDDGTCDGLDDCVGAYDDCGVCNGDGISCHAASI